jgi:hypothetical protein
VDDDAISVVIGGDPHQPRNHRLSITLRMMRRREQSKSMTSAPPWDKPNPRKKARKTPKKLSPKQKAAARSAAEKAGRRYPNLIDNMRAAREK